LSNSLRPVYGKLLLVLPLWTTLLWRVVAVAVDGGVVALAVLELELRYL
jgi:hypothetical protein